MTTEYFTDLEQQETGYRPGSFAHALRASRRAARIAAERTYTPAQEASDLATLDRIEQGLQDYFDGMGEIHARQLARPR